MAELGFFGKIPAKGDFVRHQVTDDAARSFEQWVQESNDMLRGAGIEPAMRRTRAHCKGNKDDDFFNATMDFVRSLTSLK